MSERLVLVHVPAERIVAVREALAGVRGAWVWSVEDEERAEFRVQVPAEAVDDVLDPLRARLAGDEEARVLVLPVEASLPKREEAPPPEAPAAEAPPRSTGRIAREELVADLEQAARLDRVFLVTVALSTVIAAIGLARDSAPVVIAAMVIAPLLGPNMALALATTLGDAPLAARALRSGGAGLALALVLSLALGALWPLDPATAEVAARTTIGPADLVLALATGAAGGLAATAGLAGSLVGVMVAVALLPPLVVGGMLLAGGHGREASHAFLLLATNVVCLNLAAVVTFAVRGVRPGTWWESERARRRTRRAVLVWLGLLALVAALVALSRLD